MMGNAGELGLRGGSDISFSTGSALLFVPLMCVCGCVLLSCRLVNGWLFVFVLVWEYVGVEDVFMFGASQCSYLRK